MIGWLQPSAFWGLGLLALPVAIHLLRTRHARRVPFPTVRFVQPSSTASVRIRPPSDLRLLAVRLLIVAAAVAAAAQPLWLSPSRLAAWHARVARAVVIETNGGVGAAGPEARRVLAEAEAAGALVHRIEQADLREGLRRARAWLDSAPPARREIVVVSAFRPGTLTPPTVAGIEPDIGLRFVPLDSDRRSADLDGIPLLAAPDGRARAQRIRIAADGTHVRLEENAAAKTGSEGLRVHGERSQADARRVVAPLAAAGTPAPDPAQPIALVFDGTPAPAAANPSFDRWMIATLAGIERDRELAALARETEAATLEHSEAWTVLLADRSGRALVRAAALDGELLLAAAVPASSYFAAALARAALVSRYGPIERPEQEVLTIPRERLASWSRQPGPVDAQAWRRSDRSDARWLWAAALALLVAEAWLRAPARTRTEESHAAA